MSWPVPPMSMVRAWPFGESERRCERKPGIPSGGAPSHSSRGSFAPAWPSHQSGGSRGWRGWNLAGASRNVAETSNQETKHHTRRCGEFRFIMPSGPEELTLQALSPKQRGYRVSYTWAGMIKQVCRFVGARAIAKRRTRESEISSGS